MKPTGKQLLGLVGNPDVYAVQHTDGSWTPVRERLTPKVIKRHRDGDITVGTYIVNPPDQARTLVFDIDSPSGAEQRDQVKAIAAILASQNIDYGVEFSGKKGFHLWVVVDEYMSAATLYQLGRGIREEAGLPALEVFPKQTEVRDLGNLVKLPGGVHRVNGMPNNFLDPGLSDSKLVEGTGFPVPNTVNHLTAIAALYPEVGLRKRKGDAPEVIEYPCVHDIQEGVTEGGRNIHLFHLAVMLRRWSLSEENILAVLTNTNNNGDPVPEHELLDIIENSAYSGPICNQLDDDKHCGDQCIMARHSGLYTRPGALKWAGDGEVVTVTVKDRTEEGTIVELEHPDMVQGRAVLAEPEKGKK